LGKRPLKRPCTKNNQSSATGSRYWSRLYHIRYGKAGLQRCCTTEAGSRKGHGCGINIDQTGSDATVVPVSASWRQTFATVVGMRRMHGFVASRTDASLSCWRAAMRGRTRQGGVEICSLALHVGPRRVASRLHTSATPLQQPSRAPLTRMPGRMVSHQRHAPAAPPLPEPRHSSAARQQRKFFSLTLHDHSRATIHSRVFRQSTRQGQGCTRYSNPKRPLSCCLIEEFLRWILWTTLTLVHTVKI
jgi:hypothetical protein